MMAKICECCGQDIKPSLSLEAYEALAIPRLAAIDALSREIDFSLSWELTEKGARWKRLMADQMSDEEATGK